MRSCPMFVMTFCQQGIGCIDAHIEAKAPEVQTGPANILGGRILQGTNTTQM